MSSKPKDTASAASSNNQSQPKPLLVSRKQAAELLGGVAIATIKRLEKAGVLRGRRLNRYSPTAQVFYSYDNVVAAATGAADVPHDGGDNDQRR
jgi:hypothetical protein